jgi:hypothetical protein
MSEQVTYKVKLKPLSEAQRQPILVDIATIGDEDNIADYLYVHDIQIINNVYYYVTKTALDYGFTEVTKNKDGSYEVFTSFYNEGTCLSEVLEEALSK